MFSFAKYNDGQVCSKVCSVTGICTKLGSKYQGYFYLVSMSEESVGLGYEGSGQMFGTAAVKDLVLAEGCWLSGANQALSLLPRCQPTLSALSTLSDPVSTSTVYIILVLWSARLDNHQNDTVEVLLIGCWFKSIPEDGEHSSFSHLRGDTVIHCQSPRRLLCMSFCHPCV